MGRKWSTPAIALRVRTWGIVTLGAGAMLVLYGVRTFGDSYATTRWPFTPGRIVHSEVADTARPGYQVEYEYILGGKLLRSDRIRTKTGLLTGVWPERAFSRSQAESIVGAFPIGRELPVRYNPGDVRESVLESRINWLALVPLGGGAFLALLGAGLLRRDWPTP